MFSLRSFPSVSLLTGRSRVSPLQVSSVVPVAQEGTSVDWQGDQGGGSELIREGQLQAAVSKRKRRNGADKVKYQSADLRGQEPLFRAWGKIQS